MPKEVDKIREKVLKDNPDIEESTSWAIAWNLYKDKYPEWKSKAQHEKEKKKKLKKKADFIDTEEKTNSEVYRNPMASEMISAGATFAWNGLDLLVVSEKVDTKDFLAVLQRNEYDISTMTIGHIPRFDSTTAKLIIDVYVDHINQVDHVRSLNRRLLDAGIPEASVIKLSLGNELYPILEK